MIVTNASPSGATLLQAVADAAQGSVRRLYAVGSVPASPAYPYGVFSAQMGRGDAYTLDATHGLRWVRVTFQAFGRTADSVLDVTEDFLAALLDERLVIGDLMTTPLTLELDPTPPTRDPDAGGVLGVTATLTATIN